LLNNLNAIVLTLRFEKDNATKCQYLRRVASDAVADTLQQLFETAEDAGKHIEEVRTQITTLIESQKDIVKTFVETSLDEALKETIANAEERTAQNLAEAKKQLAATTGDAVTALNKVVGEVSTDMDLSTKEEIEQLESNIKNQKIEIQDESISMLSDCIKLLVLKKMDTLTILLVFAVDALFDSMEELYKTAKEFKLDQQQLRDEVFDVIEVSYSTFQSKVSLEVQRAVTVLEAIMDNNGDDSA